MRTFLVLLALGAANVVAAPKNLPPSWPVCKKTDPKLGECIQEAVQVAVVDLSSREAKEFGIYRIDPLVISKLDIAQGQGPVSIALSFSSLRILGLKNTKLGVVDADVDNFHFQAPLVILEGLTLKGQYKINGKVLVLPIRGEGECELNLSNVTGRVNLIGKEKLKNGQQYLDATDFKFNFDTTLLKIRLENLFDGNRQLSDQMNKFLNENWTDILNELKPAIQEAFGAAFRDISNRIFHKVPYNRIFPA